MQLQLQQGGRRNNQVMVIAAMEIQDALVALVGSSPEEDDEYDLVGEAEVH